MTKHSCVHCGATENLLEEGGQFTGYWLICGGCLLEQDIAHRKLMEVIEKFKPKKEVRHGSKD